MVKAIDLFNQQSERNKRKFITYQNIFEKIEKRIEIASSANFYEYWYQIPEFIVGLPLYNLKDCCLYVEQQLKKNGFKIIFYEPNIFYISWK